MRRMGDDQWNWYYSALAGDKPETTPGHPHAGFYKNRWRNPQTREIEWEPVAIWYDNGVLFCARTKVDGSRMRTEAIDELFSYCCRAPITHELYLEVVESGRWPEDVPERAPTIGDNSAGMTAAHRFQAELDDLREQAKSWLATLAGGKPSTKTEADKAANFSTRFAEIEKAATDAHKSEKAPWLEGGRKVDTTYKPIIERADESKRWLKKASETFLIAENARLQKEARERAEAERLAAEEAARNAALGEVAQPVAAPRPVEPVRAKVGTSGRAVSLKTRTEYQIDDLPAAAVFFAAMADPPPDFRDAVQLCVNKVRKAGVSVPGVSDRSIQYAA